MRFRTLAFSSGLVAALATTSSAAVKPRPVVTPAEPSSPHSVIVGQPVADAICTLGPVGSVANFVDYIIPPEDRYFVLLRQTSCPSCGAGSSMSVTNAHVMLSFPSSPCTLQTEVSIVEALGSQSCPLPGAVEYCGVRFFDLVAPPEGGVVDFTLPVAPCAFSGRAFLKVVFQEFSGGCAGPGDKALLVTSSTCNVCTNYNTYDTDRDDLCDPGLGFPGNLLMTAEVGACGVLGVDDRAADRMQLGPGIPNPASATVAIPFVLPRASNATLRVYDVAGGLVRTLAAGALAAGPHVAVWDRSTDGGGRARPGVYFYELTSGGARLARRVVMLR